MSKFRLERGWRVLATALCFTAFGVGGLTLGLVVFPVLSLCVNDEPRRVRLSRDIVRRAFRLFIAMMRGTGVLEFHITGEENADRKGQLILANHPSLIDTVFLLAHVRNATCIVKTALWDNVFTSGPVRAASYIQNRAGLKLIDECIEVLKRGDNLIVFPEGSRTPCTGLRRFKRGAANIAVRGGIPVIPVVISCDPPTLRKGEAWYAVPDRRPSFEVRVQPPVDTGSITSTKTAMQVRQFTEFLEEYFRAELQAK